MNKLKSKLFAMYYRLRYGELLARVIATYQHSPYCIEFFTKDAKLVGKWASGEWDKELPIHNQNILVSDLYFIFTKRGVLV